MRNTAYHQQAQYIIQQVLNVVQTDRDQIFQEVKATEDNILWTLKLNHLNDLDCTSKGTNDTQDTSSLTPKQVANVTSTDAIQSQMLKILQCIDEKLDQEPPKQGTRKPCTRKNTSKYC